MNNFVIYTDSSCDIKKEMLSSWEAKSETLTFRFDGDEKEYENDDMPIEAFYKRMMDGGVAKTSAVNVQTFSDSFEKALADVDGAYTAINCEFANYIRKKYPEIRYLDREEDMGIEGLRKAKSSYYPQYLIEKHTAKLKKQ